MPDGYIGIAAKIFPGPLDYLFETGIYLGRDIISFLAGNERNIVAGVDQLKAQLPVDQGERVRNELRTFPCNPGFCVNRCFIAP